LEICEIRVYGMLYVMQKSARCCIYRISRHFSENIILALLASILGSLKLDIPYNSFQIVGIPIRIIYINHKIAKIISRLKITYRFLSHIYSFIPWISLIT
jgi:hypothetical protein